jgi:hypothetical protein
MWDVRRRINLDAMPPERTVIKFSFRGQIRGQPTWWLVIEDGDVDLCLTDPGHPVDIDATADLRAMIKVWMGDVPLHAALKSSDVTLTGPRHLVRAFPSWLKLNLLASASRPASRGAGPTIEVDEMVGGRR